MSRSGNYDRAAWFYEQAAHLYSIGGIRQSKIAQLPFLARDQQILYLGAGAGEDALMAAKMGARVTCVDYSQRMLDRLARKLEQHNLTAELICQDATGHDRLGGYDAVVANYFLNCFTELPMRRMLAHAADLLKPRGRLLIADVALAQGNLAARLFNICYLKLAMGAFWMMGMVPLHRNYDYSAYFKELNLETESVEYFRLAKCGPILFQTLVAKKLATKKTGEESNRVVD